MRHHVAKGVENLNDGASMTWWRTPFNMPIPYLWTNLPTWIEGDGPLDYYGEATSFNLGGFEPGWEICVFFCVWHWDGPVSGDAYLYSRWRNEIGSTMFWCRNAWKESLNIPADYWHECIHGCNQGVAGWEVHNDGNYSVQSWSTGAGAMSTKTTTISFSDVPDTSVLSTDHQGKIWVEGNNLCYTDSKGGSEKPGCWKHTMTGDNQGYVGTAKAGSIWMDTGNYLHWIGKNGYDYKARWWLQQIASTWTNGPTGSFYVGPAHAGKIWVDSEFGQTHIGYIGNEGYKLLTGSGEYYWEAP